MSIYCPLANILSIEPNISIFDIEMEVPDVIIQEPFFKKGSKQSEEWIKRKAESRSRIWKIQYPDGKIENVQNLKQFCRENNIDYRNMHRLKYKTSRNRMYCQGFRLLEKIT